MSSRRPLDMVICTWDLLVLQALLSRQQASKRRRQSPGSVSDVQLDLDSLQMAAMDGAQPCIGTHCSTKSIILASSACREPCPYSLTIWVLPMLSVCLDIPCAFAGTVDTDILAGIKTHAPSISLERGKARVHFATTRDNLAGNIIKGQHSRAEGMPLFPLLAILSWHKQQYSKVSSFWQCRCLCVSLSES